MTAQHDFNNFCFYSYFDPAVQDFLEKLPSLHENDCANSETFHSLEVILEHQSNLAMNYIPQISFYLRRNIERNQEIITSLDCLVRLYGVLPLTFKTSFSELLKDKYPWTNFTEEVKKLKAINRSLIEPYFQLLSKLAQWHQFQMEDVLYQETQFFEVKFLLEYLHGLVSFEFTTGMYLEGIDPCQPLLALYTAFTEHSHILHSEISHQQLKTFSLSLFYYLTTFQLNDLHKMKVIFGALGHLIQLLRYCNIKVEEEVLRALMPLLRRCDGDRERRDRLMGSIFDGVRGLLVVDWSLDCQLFWSWKMKVIYDLLGVDQREQANLIKQLTSTSRELAKQLQ